MNLKSQEFQSQDGFVVNNADESLDVELTHRKKRMSPEVDRKEQELRANMAFKQEKLIDLYAQSKERKSLVKEISTYLNQNRKPITIKRKSIKTKSSLRFP